MDDFDVIHVVIESSDSGRASNNRAVFISSQPNVPYLIASAFDKTIRIGGDVYFFLSWHFHRDLLDKLD